MTNDKKAYVFFRRCTGRGLSLSLGMDRQIARSDRVGLNLWDGRVEMEVQGERQIIEQMVQSLYEQRYIRISYIEAEEIPVKISESKFRVL